MAVDEAHRVLQVGKYVEAYPGPFAAAEKAVKEIRRLLQNGQADDARQLLGETVTSFAAAEPPKLRALAVGGGGYRGATLIDVQGKILGEFDRVNSEDKAIATIGGWQDALGFIDIGGETMNLRLDQLIFGPNGTWGEVFVVTTTPVR
ncbi:MAG TPA: hypothetical protein ENH89_08225 [Aurantimonas coralicida]|nr:hypothetical protein [Aurantimonas coralicida]